jgi:hypothetical protein
LEGFGKKRVEYLHGGRHLNMEGQLQQKDLVREQFTRTAQVFGAGSKPDDRPHNEARWLMEVSIADEGVWFHPRFAPAEDGTGPRELIFTNATLFIAGEKI